MTNFITRYLPLILILTSLIGITASFILTHDKIATLKDPETAVACDINPILSCGSVMKDPRAEIFGLPHSVFGVGAFSALLAVGVSLLAGASYKKWLWQTLQIIALFGLVGMHYLFFISITVLNVICPWCLVVWIITILAVWSITVRNASEGQLFSGSNNTTQTISRFITRHSGLILLIWYGIIFMSIIVRFWDYWSTVLFY